MAALSDHLESGILNHIFFGREFVRPSGLAIALTSAVPLDNDTGATISELPSGATKGADFVSTGYSRVNLGSRLDGSGVWNEVGSDDVTAYQVNTSISGVGRLGNSGYFYPLYLAQPTALAASPLGSPSTTTHTFVEDFPSVTFYKPAGLGASGDYGTIDAGYTEFEGNGFIQNKNQITFGPALSDWGWISGVVIADSGDYGKGNILMFAGLENPRLIYTGDSIKFDARSLEISLK